MYSNGRTEYAFEVSVPDNQNPIKGYDPEEPIDNQPIKEVLWMELSEMPEKERAFMWRYGLLEIEGFFDEVISWGNEISYPQKNR